MGTLLMPLKWEVKVRVVFYCSLCCRRIMSDALSKKIRKSFTLKKKIRQKIATRCKRKRHLPGKEIKEINVEYVLHKKIFSSIVVIKTFGLCYLKQKEKSVARFSSEALICLILNFKLHFLWVFLILHFSSENKQKIAELFEKKAKI